jgi:hypothetical protein
MLGQDCSCYIRLGHVKSVYIMLDNLKSGLAWCGKFNSG